MVKKNGGANKVSGYATDLMATLQESLKASSGIDVKELLENISGKNQLNDIDKYAYNLKETEEQLAADKEE